VAVSPPCGTGALCEGSAGNPPGGGAMVNTTLGEPDEGCDAGAMAPVVAADAGAADADVAAGGLPSGQAALGANIRAASTAQQPATREYPRMSSPSYP
jgi:hypothetical protein